MYDAVSLWSAKNVQLFHGKIVWIYKKSHQNRSKGGGCHKNLEFSKSFFVLFGRKGWVLNFYLKFKKYFSTFWQRVGGSKFFTQNTKSMALLAHTLLALFWAALMWALGPLAPNIRAAQKKGRPQYGPPKFQTYLFWNFKLSYC